MKINAQTEENLDVETVSFHQMRANAGVYRRLRDDNGYKYISLEDCKTVLIVYVDGIYSSVERAKVVDCQNRKYVRCDEVVTLKFQNDN